MGHERPPAPSSPPSDSPALMHGTGILRDRSLDPDDPYPHPPSHSGFTSSVVALVLLVLITGALRIVYLWYFCPYDLIEDEAYYWEWSRRLGWSYYSKGPGIAYLIRGATELFGDSEAAIRMVAAASSIFTTSVIGLFAADVCRSWGRTGQRSGWNWRVGFYAALLYQLVPAYQVLALITTIDGSYIACWTLACWAGWRALCGGSRIGWIVLASALGIGFLVKYTILLLVPGLLLFAIVRRRDLMLAPRIGALLWGSLIICAACMLPVLVWNAMHDWPTVRHLGGHLGMEWGDMKTSKGDGWSYNPLWTLEFIGTQFGIVGPVLLLAIGGLLWTIEHRRSAPRGENTARLFLLCCAIPIIVFYLGVTLATNGEGNWALAGYITMIALAAWMTSVRMGEYGALLSKWKAGEPATRGKKPRTWAQVIFHTGLVVGVISAVGLLRIDWLGQLPLLGRIVPVGRLMGASTMGVAASERAEALREETGLEPFYLIEHYGRAAQLAYYIPGRPTVRCASSEVGGRRTDYDFWPETSLSDETLRGRPAIAVGGEKTTDEDGVDTTGEQWLSMFERIELLGRLEGEHKKRGRLAFNAFGYRPREAEGDGP